MGKKKKKKGDESLKNTGRRKGNLNPISRARQLAPGQAVMRTTARQREAIPAHCASVWPWAWVFQQQHVKIFSLLQKGMFGKRDRKACIPPTPQPGPPHIPWRPASARAGGGFLGALVLFFLFFRSGRMRSERCAGISPSVKNQGWRITGWTWITRWGGDENPFLL